MQGLRSKQRSVSSRNSHLEAIQAPSNSNLSSSLKDYYQLESSYERKMENKNLYRALTNLSQLAYSSPCSVTKKSEMLRVFEVIARKLQLNLFELAVLHCFLVSTQWRIDHESIRRNLENVKDYVNCPNDEMDEEYAELLLYLALVGYAAKERMSDKRAAGKMLEVIRIGVSEVITNFGGIYEGWFGAHKHLLSITALSLNSHYKQLLQSTNYDYEMMAENIVKISTSYNSTKN